MDSAQKKGAFPPRALYGGGLLRIWADTVYARVMTFQETESAKAAILSIGHRIIKDRSPAPIPALMNSFPETVSQDWKLRRDRMGYFRSHLVLNSLYYLSHQNILNLDHATEAVTAPYEKKDDKQGQKRAQVLVVNYAKKGDERKALERFREAYLPDQPKDDKNLRNTENEGYFDVEDGWSGYKISDKLLALVFSCPDRETAGIILNGIQFNAKARQ